MQRKYRLLREAAYKDGRATFEALAASDPTFRDFICMYVGEGYKRNRNVVSIANSDPSVIQLAARWMRMFSRNSLVFSVQYHADQDLLQIQRFWGALLNIDPGTVQMQRKSNSGRLGGRTWRCRSGVLTVRASDTLLRARLQAWMDCLQAQWLNSPEPGRSSVW
jgi:hypothetical protein